MSVSDDARVWMRAAVIAFGKGCSARDAAAAADRAVLDHLKEQEVLPRYERRGGGKRRVVRRFARSSLAVRVSFEERGTTFAAATGLTEPEYAAHGGGVPVVVAGVGVVGGLYVSGLPQVEDHALCIAALRAMSAMPRS